MSGDNKKSWSGVDGCGSIQGSQVVITTGNSGGGVGGASHDPKNWGDVVVDGKHHSPDMIKALLKKRNELAAAVEALQGSIRAIMINIGAGATLPEVSEMLVGMESGFSATPQQHLRDVRAEAGRAGFIAGYSKGWNDFDGVNGFRREPLADQYAERVKAGEK